MAKDSETKESFEEREVRTRALIKERADRATELRSKEREFHGLEREFRYDQADMLGAYVKTKDMKHPRDMGAARENILRKYLNERGLLPKRYAVSDLSFRAASTTGHVSPELDIAIYDPMDSIRLMVREDMFEVIPIESVYGAIQVKSRLNRKEIREGLANLASVKRLKKGSSSNAGFKLIQGTPKSEHAFGILFAFDSDLEWLDIIKEIEAFAQAHPKTEWANAIFILNKGFFFHGDKVRGGRPENVAIEAIGEFQIYGVPDREELCLFSFSSTLLRLLRNTEVYPADIDAYIRLPFIAGDNSYSFQFGLFAEFANCPKHGDFSRAIPPEALEKVISWCKNSQPINWVKATHIAFGLPEDEEAYKRQPGEVYIYNPEGLPLPDILTQSNNSGEFQYSSFACDVINTAGMTIQIPYYYSAKENIVTLFCPKCPHPLAELQSELNAKENPAT